MIRAVAEFHGKSPTQQQQQPDVHPAQIQRSASVGGAFLSKAAALKRSTTFSPTNSSKSLRPPPPKSVTTPADDELHNVKDAMNSVDEYHATVVETLEVWRIYD